MSERLSEFHESLARTASRCQRAYILPLLFFSFILSVFFSSFFFRRLISEVTERISTKLGQTFGPNSPGHLPRRVGTDFEHFHWTLYYNRQQAKFGPCYVVARAYSLEQQNAGRAHAELCRASIFFSRCAMLSRYLVSVCLSDTSRFSTKTAKPRITQTTPYDGPGTSFLTPRILTKFQRGHSQRGRQIGGIG